MDEERIEVRQIQRRVRLATKQCVVCGTSFEGTARRLYCSTNCGQKVSYQKHREQRRVEQRERYLAQKAAKKGGSA
jgi:predicted nucleic acid-binding Zn ribbon protein